MRIPQRAFNPQQIKGERCEKTKPSGFTKSFYTYKNNYFRKGLIYKPFNIKQLDS